MRTPEELENYFMSSNRGEGNSLLFKDFIAEIQKESYNAAIQDAVDNAEVSYETIVDKDSILKLKIK